MTGEKIYLHRYVWREDIFTQVCLVRRYIYPNMADEKIYLPGYSCREDIFTQICLVRRYIYPDLTGEKIYLPRYVWRENTFTQICVERKYNYPDMSGEKRSYFKIIAIVSERIFECFCNLEQYIVKAKYSAAAFSET